MTYISQHHMVFIWAFLIAQSVKNLSQYRRSGFNSCIRKIPWRRQWQPTPVFLPGESHGQRSMVGYSPWGSNSWTWLNDFLFTWLVTDEVIYSIWNDLEHIMFQISRSHNLLHSKLQCGVQMHLDLSMQHSHTKKKKDKKIYWTWFQAIIWQKSWSHLCTVLFQSAPIPLIYTIKWFIIDNVIKEHALCSPAQMYLDLFIHLKYKPCRILTYLYLRR